MSNEGVWINAQNISKVRAEREKASRSRVYNENSTNSGSKGEDTLKYQLNRPSERKNKPVKEC